MQLYDPRFPDPDEDCGIRGLPSSYRGSQAPAHLLDPESKEWRLASSLRRLFPTMIAGDEDAVEFPSATDLLVESAKYYFLATFATVSIPFIMSRNAWWQRSKALADLAVSGRTMYQRFAALRLDPVNDDSDRPALRAAIRAELERTIVSPLITTGAITDEYVDRSMEMALRRAYNVAWALRGDLQTREVYRPSLRWIAVNGEDDPPHRPVNVPAPPYPQYALDITVFDRDITIRYFIATLAPDRRRPPLNYAAVPPDLPPEIPDDEEVILFVHGHSARAEEALEIIPFLQAHGISKEKRYAIIALDLPSNGYSTMFSPGEVTEDDPGRYHHPVLDFIEESIVRFVDALDEMVPIKERIAAVIGGSLGGNMCLRLGTRDLDDYPWLHTIVPWSPAGVWDSFRKHLDPFKEIALGETWGKSNERETEDSRDGYFDAVFDKDPAEDTNLAAVLSRAYPAVAPLLPHPFRIIADVLAPIGGDIAAIGALVAGSVPPQPMTWYRDNWNPCKALFIQMARLDRREIYNARFRQWHWRVAHEQLLMSHRDPISEGGERPRYAGIRSRTFLAAGEHDNINFINIYDATQSMAREMDDTPGQMIPVLDTGHSIHVERPDYFAKEIIKFLNPGGCRIRLPEELVERIREGLGGGG